MSQFWGMFSLIVTQPYW